MNNDKILITGACGFIGSHLTEALVKAGYAVKAFVQYNSFNSWGWLDHCPRTVLDNLEVIAGDVRDPFGVKNAMLNCRAVMHLAALIGIPYSYHSPQHYVETNINGTLNIVQAAKELNVEKVIHTSTSEVYGSAQYVPIDEKHPLQPQSPYSASKIGADQIAMSYYNAFNVPVTIIRPFNTYGPRQSARAVIPTTITQINHGLRQIKLGSLEPTRDFTYVADTVKGFLQALKVPAIAGQTINLGMNFEISIANLVQMIAKQMQVDVEVIQDQQRVRPEKSEVDRLWSNNTLAKNLLQWQPDYEGMNGLEQGLTQTIEWFLDKANHKLYKPEMYNV